MLPALDVVADLLPADQPRYLMGVGDPVGIVEGVARGVDMFDCVLPTRYARHGTILTDAGRLSLRNVEHERSTGPLDPTCSLRGVRSVPRLPASSAACPGADGRPGCSPSTTCTGASSSCGRPGGDRRGHLRRSPHRGGRSGRDGRSRAVLLGPDAGLERPPTASIRPSCTIFAIQGQLLGPPRVGAVSVDLPAAAGRRVGRAPRPARKRASGARSLLAPPGDR